MVQVITNLSEEADKKIKMFMVMNNITNKSNGINCYIEATEFVEEGDDV